MNEEKARVAIYIRVSTVHQIDKDSLPMQRRDLENYAKLVLNAEETSIFEDAGYSGKDTARPEFQRMMSQVRTGLFTHILVWKIDRISRNLLDFANMYNELKHLGVTFVSKNEQFDTSSAIGEAMLKIVLVFAELERNMTAERVTATMISRAAEGRWNGGRIPFGYGYNSENGNFYIVDSEAEVVKLIHDLYSEKKSLVSVARYLNDKAIFTRNSNEWSPTTLQIILQNYFYCGDYVYNRHKDGNRSKRKKESEWITVKDHHPAIISAEQKDAVISILESNQRLKLHRNVYQSSKNIHVFANLILCGNCGKPMGAALAAAKKTWQYSKYSCVTKRAKSSTDCKHTSDAIVGEFVFNYILNMINAQSNANSISDTKELQSMLLFGDTFSQIKEIESEGLKEMYDVLKSEHLKGKIYGKGAKIKITKKSDTTELKSEKLKLERALDRLTSLYLYSEDSMSESEFIIQKNQIVSKLEAINKEIGSANDSISIPDDIFIQKAGEFIIARKLSGRKYVNYKRLATTVDVKVLRSFVTSIIDNIVMDSGKVKQITFRNGLSHTFVFKDQ